MHMEMLKGMQIYMTESEPSWGNNALAGSFAPFSEWLLSYEIYL